MDYFTYNIYNALYFSIGSTIGSFTLYTLYAILSKRIEDKLTYIASKMDFILGALTGILAVGNIIYLLN
jgi:hypothetical protein